MNPVIISGVVIALVGPFLTSSIGLTDACSSEVSSKVVEFIPTAIGAVVALIGHKKTVGALRSQLSSLGHLPRA